MRIIKKHLEDISGLVFDGFLTQDVFVFDTYFTLRSLTTKDREELSGRYKYLPKQYNLFLMVDLLSYSICSIGGIKVDQKTVRRFLHRSRSSITFFFYDKYEQLEKRIEELYERIDYYVESTESRHHWNFFKRTYYHIDISELRHINQFRYYWVVINSLKDGMENEKKEWNKVEYMTNSICAFTNPKAYKKMKTKMDVTKKFEDIEAQYEEKSMIIKRVEKDGEIEIIDETNTDPSLVNADQFMVDQLKKREDETKDQYVQRVNESMKKQVSGEVVDEFEMIIRNTDIKSLHRILVKKRKEVETGRMIRELRRQKTADLNEPEPDYIGDVDVLERLDEETKSKGYCHDNVSYFELVTSKSYMGLPESDKQKVFDDAMRVDIKKEIEDAATAFLKTLYPDEYKEEVKEEKIDVGLKEEVYYEKEEPIKDIRNAAAKASSMTVDISEKDLIKERQKKEERIKTTLENRENKIGINSDEDVDQIFFDDNKN